MTVQQFDIKLFMYKLWLETNPPISEIIIENEKLSKQIKNIKYGRSINCKHRVAAKTNSED